MGLLEVSLTTTIKPGLENFDEILDAGLRQAGEEFAEAKGSGPNAYPATTSNYVRTYAWRDKPSPAYKIVSPGKTMELYGMFYGRWILKGRKGFSAKGKVLHWTDGAGEHFAMSVGPWKGWPGHIQDLKEALTHGFKYGIGEAITKR
jgi:hypothetical protein